MLCRQFAILTLLAGAACAVEIPAGAELQVRLKTKIASNASKAKDPVEAVVIAPVIVGTGIAIAPGTLLRGQVKDAKPCTESNERAALELDFTELRDPSGKTAALAAKLTDVDNARESLDEAGRIVGILASESISARMDQGISKVAQRSGSLAGILEVAKGAVMKATDPEIAYDSGVEMTLQLTKPLKWDQTAAAAAPQGVTDEAGLAKLVEALPFQTVAENPPQPSDITNLMFIGSETELAATFKAAGWSTAAALNKLSALETFRAIAEQRGYKEAPMSILLLDGRKPDLVFQKQNNTFAMRHHLRIWRRPETFQGRTVWVCAATHDIGIDFSPENRTFIHKIDSQIDRERAKVVSDFLFTGRVQALALVDRPAVPTTSRNATGDNIETDAKMAVIALK